MAKAAPRDDAGDEGLRVGPPKRWAAGIPGVIASASALNEQMGRRKAVRTMLRVNQPDGFDCPGCAWPEPPTRRASSSARTAPRRSPRRPPTGGSTADFFAAHPIAELAEPLRPLARPAGPAHRADAPAARRDALPADLLGRAPSTVIADHLPAADVAGPGRLLHVGPHEQRGRVPLPAVRPGVRHEQPPGLLEHVPRVERRRPRRRRSASARAPSRSTTSTPPT